MAHRVLTCRAGGLMPVTMVAEPMPIAVLLYGDYPGLARRCLSSIAAVLTNGHAVDDVRIGLNAVSPQTREVVQEVAPKLGTCFTYEEVHGRNVLKYPLMRRMFYDPERPIQSKHVMWFDDDSYIDAEATVWWRNYSLALKSKFAVMGSLYRPNYQWTPMEIEAISRQPWFAGADLRVRPTFATGGWWAADFNFLRAWDYPIRELRHNGGDVLLGEICKQQRASIKNWRQGVRINANLNGEESRASRRGETTPRPFALPVPYDYSHHDFDIRVERLA